MSDLAVIRATFSDWRTVKGRKQLQLIFEVPLEQQQDVLTKLGAPKPSDPLWCAIAVLDLNKAQEPPKAEANAASEKAKERYRQMPEWQKAATRAVLLCKDKTFQQWMAELRNVSWHATKGEEYCSAQMRNYLNVASRRDIATDERAYNAFVGLETSFKQYVGQFAEER